MRLKRHRKKPKSRRKAVYQTVSLLTLSTIGLAQLTTSTYATFTDQKANISTFAAAFVFPGTVKAICDRAERERDEADRHYYKIKRWLQQCSDDNVSSKTAYQLAQSAAAEAQAARTAANSAMSVAAELAALATRAQSEVNLKKKDLDDIKEQIDRIIKNAIQVPMSRSVSTAALLKEQTDLDIMLKSSERVNAYVQPAYVQAMGLADSARGIANAAEAAAHAISEAAGAKEAQEKKAAEEKAKKEAEEKAKKEAEEKAKKEAEEKAKKAAEDKAKKEAEEKAKQAAAVEAQNNADEKAKQTDQNNGSKSDNNTVDSTK